MAKLTEQELPVFSGTAPSEDMLKINISAYRVLRLLTLLADSDGLTFQAVAQAISDDPLVQKDFHEETISNYLHTLKRFGVKWTRPNIANGLVYRLTQMVFPLNWTQTDTLAMRYLLTQIPSLTNPMDRWVVQDCLRTWLAQAEGELNVGKKQRAKRGEKSSLQDAQSQALAEVVSEHITPDRMLILAHFYQYCREEQWLHLTVSEAEITWLEHPHTSPDKALLQAGAKKGKKKPGRGGAARDEDVATLTMLVEPYQLSDVNTRPALLGYSQDHDALMQVPLDAIQHYKQEPGKHRKQIHPVKVRFCLKGRLAKSYRLYPSEQILETGEETLLVETQTLHLDTLLNRLLKYNVQCEVVSPAFVRDLMRQKIQSLFMPNQK